MPLRSMTGDRLRSCMTGSCAGSMRVDRRARVRDLRILDVEPGGRVWSAANARLMANRVQIMGFVERNLLRVLVDAIAVQVDNGAVAVDDRGAIAGSTRDRGRTDIARKLRALTHRPRDRDGGAPVHGAIRRLQRWFAGFAGLAGAGRSGPCRSRRRVNATERVLRKSRSSHSE